MNPSSVAILGLLLVLVPARIAAASDPQPLPPPKSAANVTADGAESPAAGAGASSNSVVRAAEEKAEASNARSIHPINEPPDSASSCSEGDGNCERAVPTQRHPDSAAAPGNATFGAKDAAVPHGPGDGPEGAPLPASAEMSPGPARQGQEAPPDLLNALEEDLSGARRTASTEPPVSSGASSPATTTGLRSFASVGNHVFPTAPEGLGPATAARGKAAAADPDADFVDSRVTSTRETTVVVTSTPVTTVTSVTSTLGKGGKEPKTRLKGKAGKEEDAEERDEEAWEVGTTHRLGEAPPEHTTEESLFFRHFSRMESQELDEPGTTRSHLVLEKNTRLEYSSSRVVSEAYDSEEDEEEEGPTTTRPGADTPPTTPPSPLDESAEDGETSDYGGAMMEEEEEGKAEEEESVQRSGGGGDDQDPASSARGGEAVSRAAAGQPPGTSPTSGVQETTTTRKGNLTDEGGIEVIGDSSHTDTPSPTTMPSASTTEIPKESSHGMGYATIQGMASTTSSYSPRTSRRLNLLGSSTTESPVKNEVTYNETVTGSAYDFKANLSFTTPMVHLLSAVPSSSTEVSEPERGENQIQSTSPATSQTTGQSLTEVLLVSTAETTPTTELSHTTKEQVEGNNGQGGGNSINDWTTISSRTDDESSQEDEATPAPTTSSQTQSYESSTPHPFSAAVTSSVLFTTAQNTSASDLVSESMSVTSTSEEVTSAPVSSSTASVSSESVSEKVDTGITAPLGSGNESSSDSSVSSTSESTEISDNVTASSATDAMSSGATLSADVGSSTSGDLLPDQEKTKVPPQGFVDKEGSTGSDSNSQEFGISEAITVQPTFTTTIRNTTSPKEILSSTPATSKDSSPKMTFVPIVVKLNSSSTAGMTDTSYNTSTLPAGGDKESEESIVTYPWHVRLVMEISWSEMCRSKQQSSLKQALAQLISSALLPNSAHSVLPSDRVLLLNVAESCPNASGSPSEVHFCITSAVADLSSENGRVVEEAEDVKGATVVHCDAALMQLFLNVWDKTPKPMEEPLMHVKEVGIAHSGLSVDVPMNPSDDGRGVQAAIGISCVAALALFLLAALLIIMRRRQRRFNYGQRCTPVSLDAYSLDSVSVREGSRRGQARNGDAGARRAMNGLPKGDNSLNDWRASKRSYGNPAFEDDDGEEVLLSKPMNFAALTNAALDEDGALGDEFRLIPKKFRRRTVRRKSRSKNKDVAGTAERGEAGGMSSKDDDDDERLPEGAEEKNRYANVVPLTSTRVRLSKRPSGPLSTYINANFVKGPKNEERFYIACQAPLQSTIEDFWRMIWEQQSKVILMLTNLVENSVEKCADYLPPSEVLDCHRLFGDFQVTLKKREVREKYVVSSLQLKNMESNLWREVTHLWFLGWPDQGVPDEANQVIAFLIEARSFVKTNPGPTVVHCSPGTGRTGTVIAIDICIREFEQSRMIDVPKVVQQLRRDREGAVQTLQQYAFIYMALSLYAAKLTGGAMDSF